MTGDLADCYRILDLPPDATQEEVKRAYRELAKVWHPDRFTGDPKLQHKAQEKLKQINSAYERFCKSGPHEPRSAGSARGGTTPSSQGSTDGNGRKDATTDRGGNREEAPRHPPPPPSPQAPAPTANWGRRAVQFVIAVVILTVIRAIFTESDRSPRQTSDYRPSYSAPNQSYSPEPPAAKQPPKSRQHLTLQQIMNLRGEALKQRPDLGMSIQEFSRYMQANQSDYDFSEGVAYRPSDDTQPSEPPPPPRISDSSPRGYFTAGSTKDEVLSVQGTPNRMTDNEFTYKYSSVRFKNGRVESWNDISNVLKAKMLPSAPVEEMNFFTVGSTKDEVLSVQGTPNRMTDNEFTYKYSSVRFKNGRVESWNDISRVLKTK